MVDIARSSDVIRKKKIRRALYGSGFILIIVAHLVSKRLTGRGVW